MTTQEFAAKVRAKYPGSYDHADDKALVDAIVAKYPEYKAQIDDSSPGPIGSTVNAALKSAVDTFAAPVTTLAGQLPTQLPDETTAGKIGENTGLPLKGLEGITTGAQGLVEGQGPQTALQNASNVVQGTQAPPKVAGFLAGALDPRGLAMGEALNPLTKGLVSGIAEKAGPAADWMAGRVMQYAKKMVGNQFSRGMADSATEFANAAHPEIQQAIMDLTGEVVPKAEGAVAGEAAGSAAGSGETTVVAPGSKTGDPHALFAYKDNFGPGKTERKIYNVFGDPENPVVKKIGWGSSVPAEDIDKAGISITGRQPSSLKYDAPTPEGPVLEGDVVGGPKGAEYDPAAPVGEPMAPEGIDSLGRPTISAGAGTEDMYNHVGDQLKVVGDAIDSTLKGLTDSGKLWDPKPSLKQLESMYQKNASGSVIPPWDFSPQGEYNQAVSKVINAIKSRALDDEGALHSLPWEDANAIKGVIQKMANYAKPKFDPENMVYSSSGATVRDEIDSQAAKVLSQNGQDIQPFQALRGAYSKLKVLEESLNNKFAGELSAKSAIPVARTAGAATLLAAGHPLPAAAMMGDYLIRKYGPQAGAQMLRAISDNAGNLGRVAGNAAGALPPTVSAISQGLQGE